MLRSLSTSLTSSPISKYFGAPRSFVRTVQTRTHDTDFDQEELAEARNWHASFNSDSLPKGHTKYSRASGPGGQHVNKTESKATTVWPIEELSKSLPKLMCSALRSSRYYTKGSDSITIHAQTQRSRTANTHENHHKLADELLKLYKQHIPKQISRDKITKYEDLEKSYREHRLKLKKHQSSKKASRRSHDE